MKETPKPAYIIRCTQLSVSPPGESLYSERCTIITIVDEGGGESVEVKQQSGETKEEDQSIRIDSTEWLTLKDAITTMINACKQDQE